MIKVTMSDSDALPRVPSFIRRRQMQAPVKVRAHVPATAVDAVLHMICSACDAKLKFHATQWTAPKRIPTTDEVVSKVITPTSELENMEKNEVFLHSLWKWGLEG